MSLQIDSELSVIAGLVSRAKLALQLDVNQRTLMRWEHEGLPVIRVGKLRLHDPAAVRNWIISHQSRKDEPPRRGRPRKIA